MVEGMSELPTVLTSFETLDEAQQLLDESGPFAQLFVWPPFYVISILGIIVGTNSAWNDASTVGSSLMPSTILIGVVRASCRAGGLRWDEISSLQYSIDCSSHGDGRETRSGCEHGGDADGTIHVCCSQLGCRIRPLFMR